MLTEIKGVRFRPGPAHAIVQSLVYGEQLELERDPNNKYDEWAIKLVARGEFVGFVQKDIAAHLAPQLDAGQLYDATASDMFDQTGVRYVEIRRAAGPAVDSAA